MVNEFKAREYKNRFTLDGRIRPQVGVNVAKAKAAAALLREAREGNALAEGKIREALKSTDIGINLAHILSLELIPNYDKAIHSYGDWAGTRVVPDFRPVVLYSIYNGSSASADDDANQYNASNARGAGLDEHGAPLVIPQGSPYPIVGLTSGYDSFYQSLAKRGFRFEWDWEDQINDTVGFFDQLPGELLSVAVDGKVAEFFDALLAVESVSASALASGSLPDGTTVPAKAALSPEAVIEAIYQRSLRTVNGRKIGEATRYNLFAPIGAKRTWDWQMERRVITVTDGSFVESGTRYNHSLGNVTLVESERIASGHWELVPAPGSTRRPVIEFLKLRGYQNPELRVQNLNGSYVGGGVVSPFEGSFDTDSAAYRFRSVDGAVLWDAAQVVWSDGTGGAVTF